MPKRSLKNRDKRLKNLKPWKPGQSGNPKGRPRKNVCLTSLLKEEIKKANPQDKKKRTWAELIVIATMKLAIKGNPAALREVWDRIDGKAKDTVPNDDKPFQLIIEGSDITKKWPKSTNPNLQIIKR